MKLVKLADGNYVIVDNSEIKKGDYHFDFDKNEIHTWKGNLHSNRLKCKKVTHSTEPLDIKITDEGIHLPDWSKVKPLSPRKVKELLGEVDVEKKAINSWEGCDSCDTNDELFFINGYQRGYNQAIEDNKEKKYTEEDMIEFAHFFFREEFNSTMQDCKSSEEIFQLWKEQQLKTIWDVEFDSQYKLKLI